MYSTLKLELAKKRTHARAWVYKQEYRELAGQKFNSPWNIATEFKMDLSFNPAEI